MGNLKSTSNTKRSRGRPRKVKEECVKHNDLVDMLEPDLADRYIKATKAKQKRLNAVYIDTVYAIDASKGTKIELNVYRVQKKKCNKKYYTEDEDFIYVAFNSDFIEGLDTDIVPTPLGSADLTDEEIEDDLEFSDDYYNY